MNTHSYKLKVEESLSEQIAESVKNFEELLDKWQVKIKKDLEKSQSTYAFPYIIKFLIVEFQEYLYTLQKVQKALAPSTKPNFRNSNA